MANMPQVKVHVKWGKEKLSLDCNTDEPPLTFKSQLFAMTGVSPDRQKLMVKGTVVKDEEWGNLKIRPGLTLLMMGSAGALPEAPKEKTQFIEDMTEAELANVLEIPGGLTNLGNTCYMNATVQCLRAVPELDDALKSFAEHTGSYDTSGEITRGMKNLFMGLDRTAVAMPPVSFLGILHQHFPRFAERAEQGGWKQQDAGECWTEIVSCLKEKLTGRTLEPVASSSAAAPFSSFVDQFFGTTFQQNMKCTEDDNEPVTSEVIRELKLSCNIDQDVKYLHTGLRKRYSGETLTKHSERLGRDALYEKQSKISRLPAYLTIEFVRFEFKQKKAVNAKILKEVKFTFKLDMFEFCTEELQQRLLPGREAFAAKEESEAAAKAELKKNPDKPQPKQESSKSAEKSYEPFSFADDPGSNNSGYYELIAVLTHRGRSSDSGHYIAWARHKNDQWFVFDDDKVTPIADTERILKLAGGGDMDSAYLLLYGPRRLEVTSSPTCKPTTGQQNGSNEMSS